MLRARERTRWKRGGERHEEEKHLQEEWLSLQPSLPLHLHLQLPQQPALENMAHGDRDRRSSRSPAGGLRAGPCWRRRAAPVLDGEDEVFVRELEESGVGGGSGGGGDEVKAGAGGGRVAVACWGDGRARNRESERLRKREKQR